ncbi:unnamed protein product [Cuscuta campestris]|uniref:Reverse transcriptase zinc-binding domain-containing protein n=1 Tax=Cuscuta campestris TaxID=132261 RepID=A0A484L2X9_9ASTE|nr:unnamed protein product [Cuscuta campestris]
MSKINTRILANRLHKLLPKLISVEQSGFQKGKGVDEQILLVEEMVHKLDKKEKLTDSTIRKRICRINSSAEDLMGDILPEEDEDGQIEVVPISLKQAFNHSRTHSNYPISDKYNWDNLQIPKIQLFLWKLNYNLLPFPENYTHIYTSLPSQCIFCLKDDGNIDHSLLHCPLIMPIWERMALLLDGPNPTPGLLYCGFVVYGDDPVGSFFFSFDDLGKPRAGFGHLYACNLSPITLQQVPFFLPPSFSVKLPHDDEKVWWQEFDVTPRQLEEVSNQMLELYEQKSLASEAEECADVVGTQRPTNPSGANEDPNPNRNSSHRGTATSSKTGTSKASSQKPISYHSLPNNHGRAGQNCDNDHASSEKNITYPSSNAGEASDKQNDESGEEKTKQMKEKLDGGKVKAALERSRKSRGGTTRKADVLDDGDLIERELEDGIVIDAEKSKWERRQSWSKSSSGLEHDQRMMTKGAVQPLQKENDNLEEGELDPYGDTVAHKGAHHSPKSANPKRKASPLLQREGKHRHRDIIYPQSLAPRLPGGQK